MTYELTLTLFADIFLCIPKTHSRLIRLFAENSSSSVVKLLLKIQDEGFGESGLPECIIHVL